LLAIGKIPVAYFTRSNPSCEKKSSFVIRKFKVVNAHSFLRTGMYESLVAKINCDMRNAATGGVKKKQIALF
jgi:hypothetical protein